jgi:hypothetical protein
MTTATTTRTNARQIAVPPAAAAGPPESVQKERRWALVVLIMTIGAGLVTGAAKRRFR